MPCGPARAGSDNLTMSSPRSTGPLSILAVVLALGLIALVVRSLAAESSSKRPPRDTAPQRVSPIDAPAPTWERFARTVHEENAFGEADEELLRRRYLHWEANGQHHTSFPLDAHLDNGALKPLDRQDLYALIDQHNHGIEGLLAMANHRMKEAFEDYYGGARFERFPAGEDVPERTREGSSFCRDATLEFGDETVRCSFRSADYPELEHVLQELARLRDERNQAVMAMVDRLR